MSHAVPADPTALSAEVAPAVRRARRDPLHLVCLGAIGVVLALVSLPSLRGFALRQNESDALRILRALSAASADLSDDTRAGDLLERFPNLRHRFGDLEVVGSGEALRAHGYLFDLTRHRTHGAVARAWPWAHGRTGFAVYACTASGELVGHPNGEGQWSGPGDPPSFPFSGNPGSAGWRAVRQER